MSTTTELLNAYALALTLHAEKRTPDTLRHKNEARRLLDERIAELEAALVVAASGGG
jgi:hypothetical protein